MPVVYEIVPATPRLAEELAPRLRQADVDEVWASSHQRPLEALLTSIRRSPDAQALLVAGRAAALYGVAPIHVTAGVGGVWLLGSEDLCARPVAFWKLCKSELARLLTRWNVLLNFVDGRYAQSLRWAERLGFQIDPPAPMGPDGALFCAIAIRRHADV